MNVLTTYEPNIDSYKVKYNNFCGYLSPFQKVIIDNQSKIRPVWWKAYTDLKHDRNVNFNLATLENVANSLSTLFLMNLICLKTYITNNQTIEPNPFSLIFTTR